MSDSPAGPLIGIVTVLYNSDALLPDFLDSLAAQSHRLFVLYSVDNSATDSGTTLCSALCKERGIRCEVVFNSANLGVARGNNQGIALALADGCDDILLANNDIVFTDADALKSLLEERERGRFDAIVPRILFHSMPDRIWYAGGGFSSLRVATTHTGMMALDEMHPRESTSTEYAPTCFMLIRRNVFEKIGTMREPYFVYYDDTDFAYRLRKACFKIGVCHSVKIWHKVSYSTGGDESNFSLFYFFRNRILFARYNYTSFRRAAAILYVCLVACIKMGKYPRDKAASVARGTLAGFKVPIC